MAVVVLRMMLGTAIRISSTYKRTSATCSLLAAWCTESQLSQLRPHHSKNGKNSKSSKNSKNSSIRQNGSSRSY